MPPPALIVGCTYYRLTFADRDQTMPCVEPLVYLGDTTPREGAPEYAFQDTVSYVRFGSRLDLSCDNEEIQVYFLPADEIGTCVVDIERIAIEVNAAAERARTLNFPALPVLREGWNNAS
jgi:hypothetical protein